MGSLGIHGVSRGSLGSLGGFMGVSRARMSVPVGIGGYFGLPIRGNLCPVRLSGFRLIGPSATIAVGQVSRILMGLGFGARVSPMGWNFDYLAYLEILGFLPMGS